MFKNFSRGWGKGGKCMLTTMVKFGIPTSKFFPRPFGERVRAKKYEIKKELAKFN